MAAAGPKKQMYGETICCLCLDLFTDPVLTNCRHNFCRTCITQYCQESLAPVLCPQCRATVQDKFEAQLQSLEKRRTKAIERKLAEEQRKRTFLMQIGLEKEEIRSAFKKVQKFLKVKERLWLDQLGELEKETEKSWEENITNLSQEISRLSGLILEMEEKCQQPTTKFLQDIGSILTRYQKGQLRQVVELSPGPAERLQSYFQKSQVLIKAIEKLEESLEEAFHTESVKETQNKVNVVLDPDTAHPFLILTEDLTCVEWEDRYQDLMDNPTRFNREFCVLGCEKFTSGRHCWEVEVDEEAGAMWALGVARESVRRKGIFKFNPNEGIWAVGKRPYDSPAPCQLCVFTSPEWLPLNLSSEPRNIRVSLAYEEGRVEFFDADTGNLIFTFVSASFSGEGIQPFFWVVSGVRMKC